MCDTCGCGQPEDAVIITKPGEETNRHTHEHGHSHGDDDSDSHHHHHSHENGDAQDDRRLTIEKNVLSKNQLIAERNRGYFTTKNVFALNLVSSPGSGKTTLLERTIRDLKDEIDFAVIEGDQQTMRDAERIDATGVPVIQVNTGSGCHLDASMIERAAKELDIRDDSVLMIENVGNLVCPALFDLGEAHKVVIVSVTEGEDKPLKYPHMFDASDLCLINKTDLLPHLDFDLEQLKEYALRVNHHLKIFEVSSLTGDGLDGWYTWLKERG